MLSIIILYSDRTILCICEDVTVKTSSLLGMLEKALFFSEYNNINITGETSKSQSDFYSDYCGFGLHN